MSRSDVGTARRGLGRIGKHKRRNLLLFDTKQFRAVDPCSRKSRQHLEVHARYQLLVYQVDNRQTKQQRLARKQVQKRVRLRASLGFHC